MQARQSSTHTYTVCKSLRNMLRHAPDEGPVHVRLKQAQQGHNAPEFQPGPKGKSHAKTVRITGDCAASSSSFNALSCCIGAHPCTSASCEHKRSSRG